MKKLQGKKEKLYIMIKANNFSPQEKFDKITNSLIHPLMKKEGYKKKKYIFYLENSSLIKKISLTRSRYNTKDDISFNIEIQIHLKNQNFFEGPIFVESISEISENRNLYWIRFDDNKNIDKNILKGIEIALTEFAIPLLKSINNVEDIINLLKKNPKIQIPNIKVLAFLYCITERKEKGLKMIDEEIKKQKSPRFRGYLEEFKSKLSSFSI